MNVDSNGGIEVKTNDMIKKDNNEQWSSTLIFLVQCVIKRGLSIERMKQKLYERGNKWINRHASKQIDE